MLFKYANLPQQTQKWRRKIEMKADVWLKQEGSNFITTNYTGLNSNSESTLARLLDRPRFDLHVHNLGCLVAVPRHLHLSTRLPPLQPPQRHQISAALFP